MYGHLTVICGPMYAGKTTALLETIDRAQTGNERRSIVALKPAFDTRYSPDEIVSHDGAKIKAYTVKVWDDVALMAARADLVCIDEIQFFENGIVENIRDCLIIGTDVVVAGLDMDWQGDSFATTATLLGMADEVIKLKAVCPKCGASASKTIKTAGVHTTALDLGAEDKYEARCNEHWVSGL